jgi:predicted transcriptional regulator of viral defense system
MRNQGSKVRLAKLAARQWGRVTWAQMQDVGLDRGTVTRWCAAGYLHRRLPRVYAVGHPARSSETDLAEALLYAGPGAMLSHGKAAWWLGLLDNHPSQIQVSTPRQTRSLTGIKVHQRRTLERVTHKRLPTTTVPQTVIDFSARASLRSIRRVLAKADYAGILDVEAIESLLGKGRPGAAKGRPGAAKLRTALARHRPDLAATKSRLEATFFEICEYAGFELPELNVYVGEWEVDALWRDNKIAVELDGYGNHHTPAQLKRDRRKELALRTAGLTPVRYSEEQLKCPAEVIADLRGLGAPAAT